MLLIKFLEKQNFLEIKKIQSILKINFIDDSPIGYALLKNNSEVVGFLGTIFSKRRIQNQLFDHCYLHTWIVSKNYRMQSFRLIKPVLEKKVFISTFSPIKSLEGLYKKLYFEEKNYFTKFIVASPINFADNKMKLIDDRSLFENKLSESNKKERDIFLHVSALEESKLRILKENQTLKFDIKEDKEKLQAINLKKV